MVRFKIRSTPLKHLSLLLSLLAFALPYGSLLHAQCTNRVSHLSGTATVGTSSVTVTSAGNVANWTTYCPAVTSPYMIGYSTTLGSGSGSFTFNFSPAISGITLNFSGASNSGTHIEEVRLHINGAHYPMAAAGAVNACDAMAILTGAGDLRGCLGCSVSGWSGTTISGFPITTLTVEDVALSGTPNGSLFSLWICDATLPAEWLQFEAMPNEQNQAELKWSTSTEINSRWFTIERSMDGMGWHAIHEMDAAGNSSEELHYQYVDKQAPAGRVFYRIRETSQDGSTNESEVASLWIGTSDQLVLYPNPASDAVTIGGDFSTGAIVTLVNTLGETITPPFTFQMGGLEINTGHLPRGVYFIQVSDEGKVISDKLILK